MRFLLGFLLLLLFLWFLLLGLGCSDVPVENVASLNDGPPIDIEGKRAVLLTWGVEDDILLDGRPCAAGKGERTAAYGEAVGRVADGLGVCAEGVCLFLFRCVLRESRGKESLSVQRCSEKNGKDRKSVV